MVAETWQAALGDASTDTRWPTAAAGADTGITDSEIVAALRAGNMGVRPAAVTSTVAARWSRHRSLDEFLDGYRARLRPLYPDISEETFDTAVQDFTRMVRGAHPNGAVIGHDICFEIHAARWGHEHT
jgi:hypothetical protein